MNARTLAFPLPIARGFAKESSDIRWNDGHARWLLEHAAVGLGIDPPDPRAEEFEWATTEFADSSAMTLYLAARTLADRGRLDEALEVLSDACRAQRCARPTMREIRRSLPAISIGLGFDGTEIAPPTSANITGPTPTPPNPCGDQ